MDIKYFINMCNTPNSPHSPQIHAIYQTQNIPSISPSIKAIKKNNHWLNLKWIATLGSICSPSVFLIFCCLSAPASFVRTCCIACQTTLENSSFGFCTGVGGWGGVRCHALYLLKDMGKIRSSFRARGERVTIFCRFFQELALALLNSHFKWPSAVFQTIPDGLDWNSTGAHVAEYRGRGFWIWLWPLTMYITTKHWSKWFKHGLLSTMLIISIFQLVSNMNIKKSVLGCLQYLA